MDFKSNINEGREEIFKELEKFLRTETVVGDPITIGEITLVPLITVGFGYGMGEGSGTDNKEEGSGGGLGVGAKISPDAVLVINKGEVSMMPIKDKASLDKLINKVPEILDKINSKKDKEAENK